MAPQHPHRWRILAVTLAAGFMTLLDVSIVNVALPSIQRSLDTSAATVQWIVSGYALTFGLTLVAGGRLGDLVGRRRMFLVALTAFVVSSAVVGAAPSEELLVAARLLQGVAAGLLTPQNTGLIQQLFSGEERGRAFGIFGTTVGVSTAVGPVLGGVILEAAGPDLGWRLVFLVNVPIGLLALVLAARLIPHAEPRKAGLWSRLDAGGVALLGLAVLSALLPLIQAEANPLTPWWALAPVSVLLVIAFVRWERRVLAAGREPVLDIGLFSSADGYRSGILVGTAYFCGFGGIWLVLSLYLQDGLGYSPLSTGLALTPFALGSAVTSVAAGRLVARWGRWLTVGGLGVMVTGLAAIAVVVPLSTPQGTGLAIALPMLWAGLGAGAVVSPNITLTLDEVPPRMGGAASGALQTGQRLGTAVGAALLASAFRFSVDAGGRYDLALSVAMGCAGVLMLVALAIALRDLAGRRTPAPGRVSQAGPASAGEPASRRPRSGRPPRSR